MAVAALKELVKKNDLELMENIRKRFRYRNCYYINPEEFSGGLALWWDDRGKLK